MEPNSEIVRSIRARQSSGLSTSARTAMALPPAARIWSTAWVRRSSRRGARVTGIPAWAQARAVARPIPLLAPVMAMGLPASSMAMGSPCALLLLGGLVLDARAQVFDVLAEALRGVAAGQDEAAEAEGKS